MVVSPTAQHLIMERVLSELTEMQGIDAHTSPGFNNYYNVLNGFAIKTITESAVRSVDDVPDAMMPQVFLESGPSAIAERRVAQRYYSHCSIDISVVIRAETPTEALARINNYFTHVQMPAISTGFTNASHLDTWQLRPDAIADDGSVSRSRITLESVYNANQSHAILAGLDRSHAYNVIRFVQVKSISDVIWDVENAFKLIAFTMNSTKLDKTIDNSGAVSGYFLTLQNEQLEEAEFLGLTINQRDAGSDRRHLTVRLGFLCSKLEGGRV